MHPTPNKIKLLQRVHHTYLLAYAIPSIFMFLSTFRIKLVMRKLVIKALTNLMAHFTFLALNKLEPLCRLCCICLHLYVGDQQNHVVMGNAFNIALVLCTQLISCSFVYGCRRCEMKGELVSPWSYVCVLEKRLGRQPKPCLIMVETCSITIVSIL